MILYGFHILFFGDGYRSPPKKPPASARASGCPVAPIWHASLCTWRQPCARVFQGGDQPAVFYDINVWLLPLMSGYPARHS